MSDVAVGEFRGLDEAGKESLRDYRSSLKYSMDFVRPQFQDNIRFWRLFKGQMPPEIESTFSQVMLWWPYAIVDEEIAVSMRQLVQENWLNLTAQEAFYETTRKTSEKWAKYQMEKVQHFEVTAVPQIQSAHIFGNGFRWYSHVFQDIPSTERTPNVGLMGIIDPSDPFTEKTVQTKKSIITGTHMNNFNVFPSPTGYQINPSAHEQDSRLDWLIVQTYPTDAWIKGQEKFNKNEVKRLFGEGEEDMNDPTEEFKHELADTQAGWRDFQAPDWVKRVRQDKHAKTRRYRCAWFLKNDKWRCVAHDRFLLYDGPPLFDFWPLANFKGSFSAEQFFGTGIIAPAEDLVISMIQNFNMRLDMLACLFHPTTYVPQQLVDDLGGDMGRFDPSPYNFIPYEHRQFPQGIDRAVFHDRMEQVPQQAFLEQGQMKEYLEDIISQHGAESPASSASVGNTLLSKRAARSMLRALNIDMTGIQQSVEITFKLGKKFMTKSEMINTGADGVPWERIDHDAITDKYGVSITGARHMAQAEETFKKMLSIAPLMLGNPAIQGQVEMSRQMLEEGGFKNVDTIITGGSEKDPSLLGKGGGPSAPGGVPSLQNDQRSTDNRNEVQANTGSTVSAGTLV